MKEELVNIIMIALVAILIVLSFFALGKIDQMIRNQKDINDKLDHVSSVLDDWGLNENIEK